MKQNVVIFSWRLINGVPITVMIYGVVLGNITWQCLAAFIKLWEMFSFPVCPSKGLVLLEA